MIIINKLYSEPFFFEPIEFKAGINLILGEKDHTSNKTNGVGKSLLIEFINFALMKDFKHSRLSKIPKKDFPEDIDVCLDFCINQKKIVSKRSISGENNPLLIVDGVAKHFSSIDDANAFLTNLLFMDKKYINHPSFRVMMGPLIRDESSEFKSIVDCYDTKLKIPTDYTPHLYLFGIDISIYKDIKKLQKEISDLALLKRKLKYDIESVTGKKLASARSEINDLEFQLSNIKKEMESLEGESTYELIQDEVTTYENKLDEFRNKRAILKSELSKIQLFIGDNYINESEVIDLYNKIKSGLGDAIEKELNEVISFKKKIDEFQRVLIESRRESLTRELDMLSESIYEVSKKLHSKTAILKQSGKLRNIKFLFLAYEKKLHDFSQLSSFIKKYDDYDSKWKTKKAEKIGKNLDLDLSISNRKEVIKEFQETIFSIHEFVMGNRKCHFDIKSNDNKEVINIDLRIYDDGSHSNEREKVFFYDLTLLLTHDTFIRHPRLLIHDNIFDVDQDTLIKSLNYLSEKSSCLKDSQYILTLNSDKINDIDKEKLKLDIELYRRVSLTKNNRFLRRHYQEK
ncbi:TPA: DUF2326 domain-containing protein [Yersinia enterocolitica]